MNYYLLSTGDLITINWNSGEFIYESPDSLNYKSLFKEKSVGIVVDANIPLPDYRDKIIKILYEGEIGYVRSAFFEVIK